MNEFVLPIGDWSDDGHMRCKDFSFNVNKEKKELIEAYKKSEEKLGMTFNVNDSFRKIPLLTQSRDTDIEMKHILKMIDFGLDINKVLSGSKFNSTDNYIFFYPERTAILFMEFIKISLPDLNYELIEKDYLVGHWGDLNFQVGYGAFD